MPILHDLAPLLIPLFISGMAALLLIVRFWDNI